MLTAIKGEINSNTIIVGNFNTPLSLMDRSSRQKVNKENQALNDTLDQMDLTDIYTAFHQKAEYILFSSAHETFYRIDHILGHKVNLNKFKKTEIISVHHFQPQWYEIKNQLQEKNCKKHKHMKVKQYATKQPMAH